MNDKVKLGLLAVIALLIIAIFLFANLSGNLEYILSRRAKKIIAIALTGAAIAFSTVVFQTITNNKILTPSMIGLDSLYMLIQTAIVFIFGSLTLTTMNKQVHFLLSVGLMMLFAGVLYKLLFRGNGRNIYFLLLVGIICGTFFGSLTSFMEMLIDPNEFLIVQDKMFASFNNVNTDILLIAGIVVLLLTWYFLKFTKYLDVLALGKEHALNLGVNYDHVVKRLLIVVAGLISVSTALVGPITFLGLLAANVTYQFIRSYRHSVIIPGAILVSIVALVGGQLIVERVFTFSTTISVIINFVGGVYFLFLVMRENKSW
jgi:iron complex transport system permease protein